MGIFPEFEQFFSAYGSYHNNPINKAIHICCIPLILLSIGQILLHFTFVIDLQLFELTLPLLIIFILSLVYVSIDLMSGILAGLFYISFQLIGQEIYKQMSYEGNNHLQIALSVQVTCWILQFIGHGVFEKRAPALLDNILQIFVAPDFVFIEILFMLGYKPKSHMKCQQLINENIKEFKKEKMK